jgi:2-polyprenyl-6-methoxyphenol hydroxylase-like FAD-dependent oxidoreductase
VLVGADGSASAIRKQLLPTARVVDSHVAGIAGKIYLSASVRRWLGERLLSQMTMVLPVRGMAFFLAPFRRQSDATELDLPEHLFWVLIGQTAGFGPRLRSAGPEELRQEALERVRGWHPLLSDLVRLAAADTLIGVPLHTAERVPAWTPGRVTLLGDAIHTMTPLQGLGGNTALVDAALLAQRLVEADRGHLTIAEAIGGYEARMREYGFNAVAQSVQVSNAVASTNLLGRLAFRGVLGAADRLPPLRSALFQRRTIELGLQQRAA